MFAKLVDQMQGGIPGKGKDSQAPILSSSRLRPHPQAIVRIGRLLRQGADSAHLGIWQVDSAIQLLEVSGIHCEDRCRKWTDRGINDRNTYCIRDHDDQVRQGDSRVVAFEYRLPIQHMLGYGMWIQLRRSLELVSFTSGPGCSGSMTGTLTAYGTMITRTIAGTRDYRCFLTIAVGLG